VANGVAKLGSFQLSEVMILEKIEHYTETTSFDHNEE
jgi:hypothetical protein